MYIMVQYASRTYEVNGVPVSAYLAASSYSSSDSNTLKKQGSQFEFYNATMRLQYNVQYVVPNQVGLNCMHIAYAHLYLILEETDE